MTGYSSGGSSVAGYQLRFSLLLIGSKLDMTTRIVSRSRVDGTPVISQFNLYCGGNQNILKMYFRLNVKILNTFEKYFKY